MTHKEATGFINALLLIFVIIVTAGVIVTFVQLMTMPLLLILSGSALAVWIAAFVIWLIYG